MPEETRREGRGRKALAAFMVVAVLVTALLGAPFPSDEGASAGGGSVTFIGHGRGHGVGLCMAGVYYRAMRGEEYHDIIRAYYTGVDFSRVSDDMPIRVLCRDNVIRKYTLREYLYRLQEEPDSWPTQGLRVTMVAARTYVLSCKDRDKHTKDGYDICPYGSCCQAFVETIDPKTRPNTVAAVNATAGEIITYGGEPIVAAYSSCCGGYTASMEEAWGGSNLPYLSPVYDDACASDEDHDWKVTMSWEELQAKLNSHADTAVGTLYGFEVVSRWTSGRVNRIRVDGSDGSRTVKGTLFASVVGLQTHFFFLNSQNFDEYLLIQNPGEETVLCTVTYMFPGGGTMQEECEVGPRSRHTICVNDRIQNSDVSVKVRSDRPVVAERAMYFDFLGSGRKGGHACMGSNQPRTEWHFAEGYTGGDFDTFYLVQNPDDREARLTVSFMGNAGEVDELYYTLAPHSRTTIWMNLEPGLDCGEFCVKMESDLPVVAERAVYFGYKGARGGTVAEGASATGLTWYFAEGYTAGDFDTWVLLANPDEKEAEVTLEFMLPDATTRKIDIVVPGRSRGTVHVDDLPGLEQTEFSLRVQSDTRIVAERAMYFIYEGRGGGHDALGVSQTSRRWYFAEGYTAAYFDTYILLQNPGSDQAAVTLTFMRDDGEEVTKRAVIEPHARYTVHVDDLQGLEEAEFSTLVESDKPLVAERAMYFVYRNRDGGSCSQGTISPSEEWYFAEGYTGS